MSTAILAATSSIHTRSTSISSASSSSASDATEPIVEVPKYTRQKVDRRPKSTFHLKANKDMTLAEKLASKGTMSPAYHDLQPLSMDRGPLPKHSVLYEHAWILSNALLPVFVQQLSYYFFPGTSCFRTMLRDCVVDCLHRMIRALTLFSCSFPLARLVRFPSLRRWAASLSRSSRTSFSASLSPPIGFVRRPQFRLLIFIFCRLGCAFRSLGAQVRYSRREERRARSYARRSRRPARCEFNFISNCQTSDTDDF